MMAALTLVSQVLLAMPGFTLERDGAAPLTRDALDGAPYVVQFWASWCESCDGVGSEVTAALAKAPGVRYVAASLDEDRAGFRKGIAKFRKSPRAEPAFDADRKLAAALRDVAVPTVLVVGRDGNVKARIEGHFGAAQRGELAAALGALSEREGDKR